MNMEFDLAHIEFYFPETQQTPQNKQELVSAIVSDMRQWASVSYSGHLSEDDLRESLLAHIGDNSVESYTLLSDHQKKEIAEEVQDIVRKGNELLPVPTKNFIFVFPWFPTEDFSMFDGSIGFTPYSCVFHVYIDSHSYSMNAIRNTVAHELNHTIYNYHHYDRFGNYTLLDNIVIEGLAENFREEVVDQTSAPWSRALTKNEAFELLGSLESVFDSKDADLLQDILFGSNEYKRWSGYSVGYWIVKEFIKDHPDQSWEDIVKTPSLEIVRDVKNEKGA